MTFALTSIATATNEALTMNSREIAELTGKLHTHVIRDIRTMLEELGDEPDLVHVSEEKDNRGYTACFHLPKDLTLTLVSGYNTQLRRAITKRWMELEATPKTPALPTSFHEALLLAAKLEGERVALALENAKKDEVIALQAPKVDYYDGLVEVGNNMTPTMMATALGLPEYNTAAKINSLMEKLGWQWKKPILGKDGKEAHKWVATALSNERGYQTAKAFKNEGNGYSSQQLLITIVGQTALCHAVGLGLTDEQIAERERNVPILR